MGYIGPLGEYLGNKPLGYSPKGTHIFPLIDRYSKSAFCISEFKWMKQRPLKCIGCESCWHAFPESCNTTDFVPMGATVAPVRLTPWPQASLMKKQIRNMSVSAMRRFPRYRKRLQNPINFLCIYRLILPVKNNYQLSNCKDSHVVTSFGAALHILPVCPAGVSGAWQAHSHWDHLHFPCHLQNCLSRCAFCI